MNNKIHCEHWPELRILSGRRVHNLFQFIIIETWFNSMTSRPNASPHSAHVI